MFALPVPGWIGRAPAHRGCRQGDHSAIKPSRVDRERTRAEVFGTIDVVGRVADYDELFAREIELQVFADSLIGERGQIAAIVRLVTKGAGQVKELRETNQLHLQVSRLLDIPG